MSRVVARFAVAVVCAFSLVAGACGGSGGPDPSAIVIPSTAAVDGFVTNTGFVDTGNPVAVGDTDASFSNFARGFVRFDLTGIPAGSIIVSAELVMEQAALTGFPYDTLGDVVVDHVDIGPGLDSSDSGVGAIFSDVGTLSSNATMGTKTLDVTAPVASVFAFQSAMADFRLRFPTGSDADGNDDFTEFNDGDDSFPGAEVPLLIVEFFPP